ncbi:hypothetical protein C814_02838 [Anaerotruncus sp. G3(2012)]|uniref:hypothetical protein n=1 Tax=Anaerotruncus sp. G3(2012) TaxID=1235835 RepID=UPI0003349DB8|nr:hypothetical protein [Anaerotruncus sp. G3(2012)]EOS56356.1 hypothetical protein C814_02838 [Anaerotruncus sp. G3(2012)]
MEKLITRKEAAKILGISIATLDAARNNGLIAYVQYVQNGCVYFTAAGLQEWYYFYADGSMSVNTTIDGYTIGSDGARK